jgi:hypothetical protein
MSTRLRVTCRSTRATLLGTVARLMAKPLLGLSQHQTRRGAQIGRPSARASWHTADLVEHAVHDGAEPYYLPMGAF